MNKSKYIDYMFITVTYGLKLLMKFCINGLFILAIISVEFHKIIIHLPLKNRSLLLQIFFFDPFHELHVFLNTIKNKKISITVAAFRLKSKCK